MNVRRDERVTELFRQHYVGLARLAYVITGDEGEAEQIASESFLKVFSRWQSIESARVEAYLRRTVVNLARSVIRRRRSMPLAEIDGPGVDPIEPSDTVWRAVLLLPDRQRAAVVLRYYEDLAVRDIADALRCSEGTVHSQLHKARASLARTLSTKEDT